MRELDNNTHSVFLLYYHLILVVKYRKKVLNDPISDRAREIFEYIAPKYHITLEEWNHDEDHVHIMFRAHPKSELSKFINAYKSASSRLIKKRVSGDPAEALEGNVLESELLPPECRRSSDRSDPSVHRDTGGRKNMNVVYRFRIYPQ